MERENWIRLIDMTKCYSRGLKGMQCIGQTVEGFYCPINNCRMSGWAAYIKNLLDSSQGIQRAAIVGYPDGSVWARSEGDREFRATDEELKKFVTLYDHIEKVPAVGCDLEGKVISRNVYMGRGE
ncbi:profilin [Wuchereria bancrofti]|uniref:Profilin n=1 Tax=Wuchereria bancrofti TaxID=6293 RepID=J9EFE8_WUCBA|nr:profilin [Wuchereria bancrofti]